MATFFLIHSSGQGPEGWKLLVEQLERRGHRALTPAFDLSRSDESLTWHADSLVEALDRSGVALSDVVMVAHSAGGMYLPLVARRRPPRRMVFLAAAVPRPGQSLRQQFQAAASSRIRPLRRRTRAQGLGVAEISAGELDPGAVALRGSRTSARIFPRRRRRSASTTAPPWFPVAPQTTKKQSGTAGSYFRSAR